MATEKKTLKQKFLDGEKLTLLDNLKLNIAQRATDCDGMCNLCDVWYCNTYKNRQRSYVVN